MKYRLFDGGYESFLDHRVPREYQDIVVDELPQEIIEAEKEIERRMKVRQRIRENLIDNLLDGSKTWGQAQAEAIAIDEASKEEKR